MTDTRYRIDSTRVISDTLEGEAVIIDLQDGSYYSLNSPASVLWGLLQAGATKQQLQAYCAARYDAPLSDVVASLEAYIAQLVQYALVVEEPAEAPQNQQVVEPLPGKEPFVPFMLQRYEDMQEVLLADPIHDVDEQTGWPKLKQ